MVATLETPIDAEIAEVREAIAALYLRDRGQGLEHDDGLLAMRLNDNLRRLEDRKRGIVHQKPDYSKARKLVKRRHEAKTAADMVPNPCYCQKHDFVQGGPMPKKQQRATQATDLCTNGPTGNGDGNHCQIYKLFIESLRTGLHPADFVHDRHGFTPTDEDWGHIEWVCWISLKAWLRDDQLAAYGRVKPLWAGGPWEEYERFRADVKAVTIREDNLMTFIAVYRANGYPINIPMPGKAKS